MTEQTTKLVAAIQNINQELSEIQSTLEDNRAIKILMETKIREKAKMALANVEEEFRTKNASLNLRQSLIQTQRKQLNEQLQMALNPGAKPKAKPSREADAIREAMRDLIIISLSRSVVPLKYDALVDRIETEKFFETREEILPKLKSLLSSMTKDSIVEKVNNDGYWLTSATVASRHQHLKTLVFQYLRGMPAGASAREKYNKIEKGLGYNLNQVHGVMLGASRGRHVRYENGKFYAN